jgi:hypothetical protein
MRPRWCKVDEAFFAAATAGHYGSYHLTVEQLPDNDGGTGSSGAQARHPRPRATATHFPLKPRCMRLRPQSSIGRKPQHPTRCFPAADPGSLLALDVNSHPGSMSIVTKARRGTAPQRRLSHTLTWLRRLWASLRDPERCPECGLTHRKADIVRCPCDWRDGHDI